MAKRYKAILKTKSGEDAIIVKEELSLRQVVEFRRQHLAVVRANGEHKIKGCYFRGIIDAGFELIQGQYPGLIISTMKIS